MQLESSNSHLFLYVSKAFESFLKYDYKLNKCMFLRVYVLLRIGIKCVSTQWNRAWSGNHDGGYELSAWQV